MATTSPDNIYSPDAVTPFELTVNLATMADSMQAALTSHAENAGYRRGDTVARTAATASSVEGDLWFDTTLDTMYRHDGTSWVEFFHDFKAWTPSLTGISLGNGASNGQYQRIGGRVFFEYTLTIGSTTSVSSVITVSLPVTPLGSAIKHIGTGVWTRGGAGLIYPVMTRVGGGSTFTAAVFNSSLPIVTITNLSNSYPAAPASGDVLYLQGMYRVA